MMASISWGTCRGRCGSKQSERLNELNEVFQYSNAMLFFIPTFVLRAENEGVCCGSDLVAQDGSAQRIRFWNTPTPSRVLQTMGTICKNLKLKQQCLAWHYQWDIWFVEHRNRFWGAAIRLAAIFTRYRCWNSKRLEEHITLAQTK